MVFEDLCGEKKENESITVDSPKNETDTVDHHDKPGPLHGYEWRELPVKVIGVNFFKLKNCKVCRRLISKYSKNDMLRGSQST